MIRRTAFAVAIVATLFLAAVAPANAATSASTKLRIAERTPGYSPYQVVTVTATNSTTHILALTVTYQSNRLYSLPKTVVGAVQIDAGGSFSTEFLVRQYRDVDGLVKATVTGVGGVSFDASKVSLSLS